MNTTITDHIRDILEHRRKRLWGRPQSRKIVIFQWILTYNVVTIGSRLTCLQVIKDVGMVKKLRSICIRTALELYQYGFVLCTFSWFT